MSKDSSYSSMLTITFIVSILLKFDVHLLEIKYKDDNVISEITTNHKH